MNLICYPFSVPSARRHKKSLNMSSTVVVSCIVILVSERCLKLPKLTAKRLVPAAEKLWRSTEKKRQVVHLFLSRKNIKFFYPVKTLNFSALKHLRSEPTGLAGPASVLSFAQLLPYGAVDKSSDKLFCFVYVYIWKHFQKVHCFLLLSKNIWCCCLKAKHLC